MEGEEQDRQMSSRSVQNNVSVDIHLEKENDHAQIIDREQHHRPRSSGTSRNNFEDNGSLKNATKMEQGNCSGACQRNAIDSPSSIQRPWEAFSRGAAMLEMARGGNVVEPKSRQVCSNVVRQHQSVGTTVIQIPRESYANLKELNPDYFHYQSEHVSFCKCFIRLIFLIYLL